MTERERVRDRGTGLENFGSQNFYGYKIISSKMGLNQQFSSKKSFDQNYLWFQKDFLADRFLKNIFIRHFFGRKFFMAAKSFLENRFERKILIKNVLVENVLCLQNHFLENRFELKILVIFFL